MKDPSVRLSPSPIPDAWEEWQMLKGQFHDPPHYYNPLQGGDANHLQAQS